MSPAPDRPVYDQVERFAVLADLPPDVEAFLNECKAKVREVFPGAVYLEHRPHLTIFVARDSDPAASARSIEDRVRSALADPAAREIRFRGWRVFERDALAAGGSTLVLDAVPTVPLIAAQHTIAEAWRHAWESRGNPENTDPRPEPGSGDPMLEVLGVGAPRESLLRYGWPFVGPHWLPHATVASIPAGDEKGVRLLAELRALSALRSAPVRSVELARVRGDEHRRLASVEFA